MIKFVPFENEDVIGIKAVENDLDIGYCTFELNGFVMTFLSVDCDDDIVTEGIARSAMNFGANRNAYIAKINKNFVSPAFLRLGFSGEEILSVEIPVALTSGCSCGH